MPERGVGPRVHLRKQGPKLSAQSFASRLALYISILLTESIYSQDSRDKVSNKVSNDDSISVYLSPRAKLQDRAKIILRFIGKMAKNGKLVLRERS